MAPPRNMPPQKRLVTFGCLLLLRMVVVTAFGIVPSIMPYQRISHRTPTVLSLSSATMIETTRLNDTLAPQQHENSQAQKQLEETLHRLMEQSGDSQHFNVVAKASECEQVWKQQGAQGEARYLFTVLKAWTKCAQCLAEHRNDDVNTNPLRLAHLSDVPSIPNIYTALDAAEHAATLLEEQGSVDRACFHTVLDAFAKTKTSLAPERISELIQRMKAQKIELDTSTYNPLMEAYSHHPQLYLNPMLKLFKTMKKDETIQPNIRTINSLLHAYSRNDDDDDDAAPHENAQICVQLFESAKADAARTQRPTDQPDSHTYTTVMYALSKCGNRTLTLQAEDLFREMQSEYSKRRDIRLQPTVYTYTVLILAWAKTPVAQAPERAEAWLQKMLNDPSIRFNAKPFTAAIQAWSRSRDNARKASKAWQLLQQMNELATQYPDVAPTLVSYQTALDACSRTRGTAHQQTMALKIAFDIFRSMRIIKPNHVIFATLLRATSFLMPPGAERNSVAKATFAKAVAAGQVDESVVKALQRAADSELLLELLPTIMKDGHGSVLHSHFPAQWSRNVRT